ncbi:ATP-dependent DNA ligase [Homoserinimonas sp. A520]
MPSNQQFVDIDGNRLKLTSLDKVLYPETGTTKADVLDYYARIADVMIPHIANRPVTRKRWVNGVGTAQKPGQVFFQKNLGDGAPDWVATRTIQHKDHVNEYPLANDRATLAWLGQIAALEVHVPQWQFGRTGVQKNPDRLVLDLDPGEGAGLAECAEVAQLARAILTDMGLDPLPVTSGSKGIHLYAALDGKQNSETVSAIAHELARALEADHPELIVSDMKKALRGGKVLVDWSQNNAAKTTVAPYSLRGKLHPMVAAPRTWRELASANLKQLDYTEVLARVKRRGDPLAGLTSGHLQSLEPTEEHLASFEATEASRDRLAVYRAKRDPTKTKEPMGAKPGSAQKQRSGDDSPSFSGQALPAGAESAPTFVIQEHHARRLHYDFRLEHDGVLVSWAVPKGMPTDPAKNHLAVQTEDHPLEYGTFEGSIPAGEYGGGEVTIWDAGTYELEKWREGKEVIVTLHGEKHGSHRYALIHTGGRDGDDNNWLLHLMKDDAPASKPRRKVIGAARRGPKAISPMLATLGTEASLGDEDGWAFEMKWDGIRAIAVVEDGQVRYISRNGIDLTVSYPELAELADAIQSDAVVDGEIVALDKGGRPSFGLLQSRMKLTRKPDVDRARQATPVHFMVFDLLELDGEPLLSRSYDDRRAALEDAVNETDRIRVPPAFDGDSGAAMASSLGLGLEGVMAKKRDGRYRPGVRSQGWVKIKHHSTQEVVIAGWKPGNGRRSGTIGSLVLGIPDDAGLRYVGRVGTGFGDKELDDLLAKLTRLERKTTPLHNVPAADARGVNWVTPSLVGEVEFAEWTHTDRLRQPSWRGLRPDKAPEDIVLEAPVAG